MLKKNTSSRTAKPRERLNRDSWLQAALEVVAFLSFLKVESWVTGKVQTKRTARRIEIELAFFTRPI